MIDARRMKRVWVWVKIVVRFCFASRGVGAAPCVAQVLAFLDCSPVSEAAIFVSHRRLARFITKNVNFTTFEGGCLRLNACKLRT